MEHENSISIINKNNGQVTGESAQALPIKLTGQLSWTRYVLIGFILAAIVFAIFITTAKKSVVAVEVSGASENLQIFKVE